MTLEPEQIEARLQEYLEARPDPGRDDLALLETALFVEEALGIRLSDDEIVQANLGSLAALRRFIATRPER